MRQVRIWAVAVAALLGTAALAAAADAKPSYTKDVEPFLTKYCLDCHNNGKSKAGYSVETVERLVKKGKKGAIVVAEKPDESRLLLSLAGKGKAMPPANKPQPKADEIAKVREWIKAGAKDDTPDAEDKKKGTAGGGK